ncbi:MAG: hypothetical protein H0U90_07845, partial [Actinobacteria bacterium]|nr:hypothetical protein [Actinomycetota bacterium]
LEPWQREFVDELYRLDERGNRIYKRAILGVPRGNGKSPIAAAVGLYELMTRTDEPDVICAAAARDQAGVVFEYARGFAESGPLAEHLVIGRREIARPETKGVLRTISADGYVAHGANPSAVIVDEAHAFTTDKQRELFEAMDTAVHKRPDAFWLTISTAGHDSASLFGKLYSDVLEQLEPEQPRPGLVTARDEANGVLFYWWGAAADCDPDDERLWEAVNPGSWVTVADLRRQRRSPSMATSTFKRRHLNAWVAPEAERWIPGDTWNALPTRTRASSRERAPASAVMAAAPTTPRRSPGPHAPTTAGSTWPRASSRCGPTFRTTFPTRGGSTTRTSRTRCASSPRRMTWPRSPSTRATSSRPWTSWPTGWASRPSSRSSRTPACTARRSRPSSARCSRASSVTRTTPSSPSSSPGRPSTATRRSADVRLACRGREGVELRARHPHPGLKAVLGR